MQGSVPQDPFADDRYGSVELARRREPVSANRPSADRVALLLVRALQQRQECYQVPGSAVAPRLGRGAFAASASDFSAVVTGVWRCFTR